MTSGSIPSNLNSFEQEYKLRSSRYTHAFHLTDFKGPDIHVIDW